MKTMHPIEEQAYLYKALERYGLTNNEITNLERRLYKCNAKIRELKKGETKWKKQTSIKNV